MNLIDRDKLIEEVEYYISHTMEDSKEHYAYKLCKELIDRQPTVNQWIPCKERLPKENGTYLATIKSMNSSSTIEVMYYAKGQKWVDVVDNTILLNIIAWCELPKPYEEKENVD